MNLPKLEILEVGRLDAPSLSSSSSSVSPSSLEFYMNIIKSTSQIERIEIETWPHPPNHQIISYNQIILKYCSKLEYVSFWYFNEIIKDLEEFLTCSIQLKGINMEVIIYENDNSGDGRNIC